MTANETMLQLYKFYSDACETTRVLEARKLWYWYQNDKEEIINYVTVAMSRMFSEATMEKMNIRVYNVVERVVNKLALIYKHQAQRFLDKGREVNAEGQVEQSKDDERFQELLSRSDIVKQSKEWGRLGKLFNTVLVQPIWNPEFERIEYNIHTPAWTVVQTDEADYLKPKSFLYAKWITWKGMQQEVLVYWSVTEHYMIDADGNKISVNKEFINPFIELPVAVLRFKDGSDFWGEGMWDLVDGNEEVCAQFSNLCYTAIFQSHGQPVVSGADIEGKIALSPDSPIVLNGRPGEDKNPTFGFESANPLLTEVREMIDWMWKWLQSNRGLPPESFALEQSIASGVSKMMDSASLTEIREDDKPVLGEFEKELFRKTAVVYNYYNPTKKINPSAKFNIKFGESRPSLSVDEKIKDYEAGIRLGYYSRLSIIMKENPELTQDEAVKRLEQIIEEQGRFNPDIALSNLLNQPDVTNGRPAPASA